MASHSSATAREETPHVTDNSVKRCAQSLINDKSIDAQTRGLIRYALEIKDPYLGQLVRRVEAGEIAIDRVHLE